MKELRYLTWLTVAAILSSSNQCHVEAAGSFVKDPARCPHRGVYELSIETDEKFDNPYAEVDFKVSFTRPDGTKVGVDGFYDGSNLFKARAYCDTVGRWQWRSSSNLGSLNNRNGQFNVVESKLKGKLRIHARDPRQFAYDNGQWFLHIGDTGYRYVTKTEPKWKEYIDQAAKMGVTKIRTWFCQGRSDVQILFANKRRELNLDYFQEIDRRLLYALEKYPHIQFKLIPYGEDTEELRRYDAGDSMSNLVARYSQARFSALPNIHWCVSNDRDIVKGGKLSGRKVYARTIDRIARDMKKREPWGSLLTNHQKRFSGYEFVDAEWSNIITIEDLDQVTGEVILKYRKLGNNPVINDEDRYEKYRQPEHPRYFFRRLMWSSLLSGGHATYGGLATYEPYDGNERGVQGYYDNARAGKLEGGDDFVHIHKFFNDSGPTLVAMQPDDAAVGNDAQKYKCIHNDVVYIVYLANPNNSTPQKADVSSKVPSVNVRLKSMAYSVRWFNPRSGKWTKADAVNVKGENVRLRAPSGGDWILLLQKG